MCKPEGERITLPTIDQVLVASELVLDAQGKLREVTRVAGENEVSIGGEGGREGGREEVEGVR